MFMAVFAAPRDLYVKNIIVVNKFCLSAAALGPFSASFFVSRTAECRNRQKSGD